MNRFKVVSPVGAERGSKHINRPNNVVLCKAQPGCVILDLVFFCPN